MFASYCNINIESALSDLFSASPKLLWQLTIGHCLALLKPKKAYSTMYSQAVTHPSTNIARPCLTSVIRRELVYSRWYGRRHWSSRQKSIAWSKSAKQQKESWVFCFTLMPLSADLVGQPANLYILVQSLTCLIESNLNRKQLGQSWTINYLRRQFWHPT